MPILKFKVGFCDRLFIFYIINTVVIIYPIISILTK
uniref:Uncharacterized protein n=1 Tax=virus sp. ctReX5 TaxID=2825818 RepID=A0A8S5RKU5_9VIRU|nr:MAG TPA: hypothetical protein [virus sp. ctReX5]